MTDFNEFDRTGQQEEKLQEMIAQEEAKLEKNYCLLGRAYMEIHSSNYEEAVAGYAQLILESEKMKDEYCRKLMKIRGVVVCENCGSEMPEQARFCSVCGQKMPEAESDIPDGKDKCRICGAIQQAGMRFCMNCGSSMTENPKEQSEQKAEDSVKKMEEEIVRETKTENFRPTSQVEYCIKCGSILEEDALFCSECGAKQK